MPWPIRLYTSRDDALAAGIALGLTGPPVGAMWPAPMEEGTTIAQWCEWYAPLVARRYLRDDAHRRPPMYVKLPDGSEFCVDFCASTEIPNGGGEGWGCAGEPPAITLSPSVHIIGRYHGWIRDGVITDDCDGRTFPDEKGVDG